MYQLIITEKPSSSLKIANALADNKVTKKKTKKITYYELTHKGKKIVVVCAVGHLYNLAEKDKKKWHYPIFDIEWKESYKINKASSFTKEYLDLIKKLTQKADSFIVATDFDVEGEVIGLNIVRFACNKKDANRMKYSTLTKDELIDSYENRSKHLDWGQAHAGETRHYLDYYYGVNLSRALTLAIKHATNGFKIMSSGRVQGPALKILADREKKIRSFKSEPFWEVELIAKELSAFHKKGKIKKKEEATSIIKKTKGKAAIISKLKKTQQKQYPPNPFDLTSLQLEAHKTMGLTPKRTLQIAQSLYLDSLISYPRTSSNQLPPSLNYKKIIQRIGKQSKYKKLADELLQKELIPNNGKKTDAAHPAIYPTGEFPKKLTGQEFKLYDLIVKRTLATFSIDAIRETMSIEIDCNKEIFSTKGTKTVKPGWHKFYEPFLRLKEEELPELKENQELKVKQIKLHEKETQPPKRYTAASIIKELEKRNLGTKATRAAIVDALYERDYVEEKSMEVTELGLKTVDTLKKYSPDVLDENLTRHFEEEMEKIRSGKKKPDTVVSKAKQVLTKILANFKKHEEKIGKALSEANRETRRKASRIGDCPVCKKGELRILRGKYGTFVACSDYPECKTTFSLPHSGLIKSADKVCDKCNFPKILVIKKGKRPQELCINPDCPSKAIDKKLLKEKRKCPKCGTQLVIKKSAYGSFFACPGYPKCRHIEPIQEPKKKNKQKK